MTAVRAVPAQAGAVREEWLRLAATTADPPRFDPSAISYLPQPAQRWLTRAIKPGMPLWQTVELSMRGQIKQWGIAQQHAGEFFRAEITSAVFT